MTIRAAAVVATLAGAMATAGCSHGGAAVSAPRSEPARFAQARPVAERLMRALAAHRSAADLEAPDSASGRRSLDALSGWLGRVPVSQLRMVASDVPVNDPQAAGVLLTLSARLGRSPSSIWVDMGQRALEVRLTSSGWRVSSDISSGSGIAVVRSGLGAIQSAFYWIGRHCIVVDTNGSEASGTARAGQIADLAVPALRSRYGSPPTMARPVIFVLPDWAAAQPIANDTFPHEAVGVEFRNLVYMDASTWLQDSETYQRSVIVHELTHVVTAPLVGAGPESLIEGIAEYQQDLYLTANRQPLPLDELAAAYAQGYPSEHRWTQRLEGTWGLRGSAAIHLAYEDGMEIVRAVVERHGGIAAIKRLGAAFRRVRTGGDFTPAGLDAAFRSALGVPFARVVAEAHQYVARG